MSADRSKHLTCPASHSRAYDALVRYAAAREAGMAASTDADGAFWEAWYQRCLDQGGVPR